MHRWPLITAYFLPSNLGVHFTTDKLDIIPRTFFERLLKLCVEFFFLFGLKRIEKLRFLVKFKLLWDFY